jgi:hypothetical protein
MLAEVEPRLHKDLPPGHYAFGSLLSERSLLELERGDLPSALRLANQAVDVVEAATKAGKAGRNFLPMLYQRRAKVELQADRSDLAANDIALALDLIQKDSQPHTFSSKLGRTYLLLARILQAQGKVDEARAAARTAAEHLQSAVGPLHPETRSARQLAGLDPSGQ